MDDILNITGLGRLEIVETYIYYDQPVLFSCKSAAGHLYLAVATDKNDEYETWLSVGVSVERLKLIRSGVIDLHDAFAKPEDGFLLQETILSDDHTQPRMERIQPDQISADMLPMPGERLDLEIETFPEKQIRMDTRNPSVLGSVLEKIAEIAEKSATGDYIYRGEPEHYDKVSSNLYREYEKDIESESFDIAVVQAEILKEAREYTTHKMDDTEILTELQHHGGKTNLIDFTTDCFVALFFACNGNPDKPGRVILLGKESKAYDVLKPPRTITRAEAQKSIFVRAPSGVIEPDTVVCIPADLKGAILEYLRKHNDISTKTIYNDLQGFIENQGLYKSAYTEFYKGFTCQDRGDSAKTQAEKQQWYDVAITHYTEAIGLKPDLVMAYNNRGVAYREMGDFDAAIQNWKTAIELNSENAGAYYNRGVAYYVKGDFDAAIEDYSKAIGLNSENANAHNNRGVAYRDKGDFDAAIEDYSKAIELNSENAGAYYNRGNAYRDKGDLDAAIEDYSKAIELNPEYADVYSNRGIAYHNTSDLDAAIDDYSKAISLNPEDVRVYRIRGIAYSAKGEYDRAIEDFNKSIDLNPEDTSIYRIRGIAYAKTGDFGAAIDDYNKAIELNPELADAYSNRGVAYHNKGDFDEAIQDFNKAIDLDSENAGVYSNRGEAWLHLKEWEKARADLTIAKDKGVDIVASFHNDYESVEAFEAENEVEVPEDIAALLQLK